MNLPRALTEVPNWDEPKFDDPITVTADSDGDGVIDPWDCQPFNPDADGFLGDMYQQAKNFVTPNRQRAADRRAAVGRAVSSGVSSARGGVRSVRGSVRKAVRKAPIHVSRQRAADRRARVVGRVRDVHKRATTSSLPVRDGRVQPFASHKYSAEAAAGRRQLIGAKLERAGAKVGVDFGRAADRRADLRAATKLHPIMDVNKMSFGFPQSARMRRRARDLPEPNLDSSDW